MGCKKRNHLCHPQSPLLKRGKQRQVCILAHVVHGFFGYRTRCEQWRLGITQESKAQQRYFATSSFSSRNSHSIRNKKIVSSSRFEVLELFGFLKGAAFGAECHNLQQQTYRIRSQESGRPATCCIAIATRNRASTQTFLSCRARDAMLHP